MLGLGMGGEWNTGATLVAETWPTELRAKAISIVQSSWALGFAAAAVIAGPVARWFGWRAVFFVGILPALVTLWIQRSVRESEMWRERTTGAKAPSSPRLERGAEAPLFHGASGGLPDSRELSSTRGKSPLLAHTARSGAPIGSSLSSDDSGYVPIRAIFRPPYVWHTFALLFFNVFALFSWWGLFTWLPPYLSLPVEQGGRGFGVLGMTSLMVVLNLFGMFPGYLSFGWVADHIGRRNAVLVYTIAAAALIPLYAVARSESVLLVIGTLVAFFGTGIFSGSGIMGSEIFPTAVRARALGFTYNGARAMSSLAPLVIGRVGEAKGLSWAFFLCAAGYLMAALMTSQLPETRGKRLE